VIDNKIAGNYMFDMMPKTPIKIKYPTGTVSYDPVTNKDIPNYTTVTTYAYVGTWDTRLVNSSQGTNQLGPESKRVIVRDIDVDMDCLIEIGEKEYRVSTIESKSRFLILGVTPK